MTRSPEPLRRRHRVLLIVAVLLLTTGFFAWKGIRQEQLNRALLTAIKHQETGTALSLLTAGADANTRDVPSDFRWRWRQFWNRLRGKKSEIESASSALHLAVEGSSDTGLFSANAPLVTALLDRGADINARDAGGTTPLMDAVDKPIIVRLLLERGADINLKDNGDEITVSGIYTRTWHLPGQTAMQCAQDLRTMELLLAHGANVNAKDEAGTPLLMEAVNANSVEKVRFLISHGADVNAAEDSGCTALMKAVSMQPSSNSTKILELLLQHGADVNARDHAGKTALIYYLNRTAIHLLPQKGADPNIKSFSEKTAKTMARQIGDKVCLALLQQAERKHPPK